MISFIIPTLNEGSVIEKTLKNLMQYSLPKEIIISDGKSKDRTLEIAKKYTDKIVVHDKPHRQTIAEARNEGAKMATGETLVFLDADVYIPEPDKFFSKVFNIFENNKNIVAIVPSIRVFKEMENTMDMIVFSSVNFVTAIQNNVVGMGGGPGEFQIVKKDSFFSVGGFNEHLAVAEDQEFLRRLAKKGKIRFENKLRVYHTGRRAHKLGWPRLLWSWQKNLFYTVFFKKAFDNEWKEIR